MAGPNELLIKINGDSKNAIKAFDDVTKKTEDLQGALNTASLIGAAAFAALTAEIYLSVQAFGEGERSSNQLSQALQNQGMFTTELKESYTQIADAISKKTGIDDDQIVSAQATAQAYIGQQEITKELAQTIVDFGTKVGGAEQAAALIGKTIGGTTNALARYKVTLTEGATQAEKTAEIIRQLNLQVGGNAEAANKGVGSLQNIGRAFEDVQKKIGERFAPAIVKAGEYIVKFFDYIAESPKILDFAAALIAGGAAAAALVAVAAPLVAALTTISAALVAAGVAGTALTGVFYVLAGATGIGLLVGAVVLLVLNWDKAWLQIKAVTLSTAEVIGGVFQGLAKILAGALLGDLSKVSEGVKQISESAAAGYKKYVEIVKEGEKQIAEEKKKGQETQDPARAAAAEAAAAQQRRHDALLLQQRQAHNQLVILQSTQASQELIQLKQEEIQTLKALEDEKDAAVITALETRLARVRELEEAQRQNDLIRAQEFNAEKQALEAELEAQGQDSKNPLLQAQLEALKSQKQTELDIENQAAADKLKAKIAADNLYLADQKKFGVAYATINKLMHSEIYQGTKTAFGELAQLQASSNSTLKGIGKAAAIANIIIKTGESAMNIYAGFSTIPIIGPTLGIAGAAAAIAFGAEQVRNVTSAASGALVGGSGSGDTQPFMLEPGELVAPKRNFNDVVNGVQTERSGIIDEVRDRLGALEAGGGGNVVVNVQGDFVGDESYIGRLSDAISNAIEFRNQRFVGVNA